jgi:hypothetical protein
MCCEQAEEGFKTVPEVNLDSLASSGIFSVHRVTSAQRLLRTVTRNELDAEVEALEASGADAAWRYVGSCLRPAAYFCRVCCLCMPM